MSLLTENNLMLVHKSTPRFVICDFFHSPHIMSLFPGVKSEGVRSSGYKLWGDIWAFRSQIERMSCFGRTKLFGSPFEWVGDQ